MAFTWPVRVYWEDTDAGGIVFYANYLKFFERARTEWLRALGHGQHELKTRTGGMFVVTNAELRYLHPARLDDELLVTATIHEHSRASLTVAQQALRPGTGTDGAPTLLCEALIRIGWVSADTLKPQRIPSTLLEQLSS
ncbi:MAG: tol-pal system-associated acyl-CoA thioesterase [Comamonas sp. SCN 67-35]|uniref:tol-pal system-associated acyl-CoA thioesterase n=1 Tax=unclassified Comamonas TaxID=2638500 RepID=UPI00086A2443|nr:MULTISPECIES: tol-pal system-associated acyl-CoA thioesterase [unclassified Comamonas]MBN9330548.1 tol-pal system-associated acyl-CoA thioesterase [Comamonas sp.]ODU39183.1 MAG: tol-pal system-associated acyl-CoA thioesterase [Comamonas sp. SCN 67-35]OJW98416.1 MAG: tol-pal system-associated acyl-CoA thioesterase [Burkholderiales bacterium 66-26]